MFWTHKFAAWTHWYETQQVAKNCKRITALFHYPVWTLVYSSLRAWIPLWAMTCDFQQCGIFTSVDSDEPVLSPFKLRNFKWCSVRSLTLIKYSSDKQRLWSDCAYAQADLRLCWSHISHCWKSHVTALIYFWDMTGITVYHSFNIQKWFHYTWALSWENLSLIFAIRLESSSSVQLQSLDRVLKFCMQQV